MLSRVSAFADISDDISLEQLFEYAWPEEGATDIKGGPTYYVIQELLADYLKVQLHNKSHSLRLNPLNVDIRTSNAVYAMHMNVHGYNKKVLYHPVVLSWASLPCSVMMS